MSEKDKKKPKFKKANVVELGSKPPHGRIVWVGINEKEKRRVLSCGATHEGLRKALRKNGNFDELKVIDLKTNRVIGIPKEVVDKFIKKWGENYLNPKWGAKAIGKLL